VKVHPRDGTSIGLCAKGQRRFCVANGIDVRRFFTEGVDVSEIAHLDDENVRRIIASAEARERRDGQS
jgi:hypothetical protein